MGGAVVLGSCKMVLLIALDYVVILSVRLLKAGLPAMLCFCFLYNTIPVRLIIWQSTTPIIPKFCRLKSRPKFQKVLTRVDCLISQLAFHADDPVTEKALSATPWRTMKLLWPTCAWSQSTVVATLAVFCQLLWDTSGRCRDRCRTSRCLNLINGSTLAANGAASRSREVTRLAISQDGIELRIIVVFFPRNSDTHVPKQ